MVGRSAGAQPPQQAGGPGWGGWRVAAAAQGPRRGSGRVAGGGERDQRAAADAVDRADFVVCRGIAADADRAPRGSRPPRQGSAPGPAAGDAAPEAVPIARITAGSAYHVDTELMAGRNCKKSRHQQKKRRPQAPPFECNEEGYVLDARRRRTRPSAVKPRPSSASEAGSGVGVGGAFTLWKAKIRSL